MPAPIRLDVRFDPEPLLRDATALLDEAWRGEGTPPATPAGVTPESKAGGEGEGWAWAPLREPLGRGPGHRDCEPLAAAPAVRSCLDWFRCPVRAAGLLRLGPGAERPAAEKEGPASTHPRAWIHVPIVTDGRVPLVVAGDRIAMRPGEAWALGCGRAPRLRNDSPRTRVHLLAECVVDDWLAARLREALGAA